MGVKHRLSQTVIFINCLCRADDRRNKCCGWTCQKCRKHKLRQIICL